MLHQILTFSPKNNFSKVFSDLSICYVPFRFYLFFDKETIIKAQNSKLKTGTEQWWNHDSWKKLKSFQIILDLTIITTGITTTKQSLLPTPTA